MAGPNEDRPGVEDGDRPSDTEIRIGKAEEGLLRAKLALETGAAIRTATASTSSVSQRLESPTRVFATPGAAIPASTFPSTKPQSPHATLPTKHTVVSADPPSSPQKKIGNLEIAKAIMTAFLNVCRVHARMYDELSFNDWWRKKAVQSMMDLLKESSFGESILEQNAKEFIARQMIGRTFIIAGQNFAQYTITDCNAKSLFPDSKWTKPIAKVRDKDFDLYNIMKGIELN